MRMRAFHSKKLVVVLVLLIVFLIGSVYTSFNDHEYTVEVTAKERIVEVGAGGINSYYLIFCKDNNGNYYEFKTVDEPLRLKFNSSTVYNQIEIGNKYKFTVVGFRIPLLSSYENIIKFEKIE